MRAAFLALTEMLSLCMSKPIRFVALVVRVLFLWSG